MLKQEQADKQKNYISEGKQSYPPPRQASGSASSDAAQNDPMAEFFNTRPASGVPTSDTVRVQLKLKPQSQDINELEGDWGIDDVDGSDEGDTTVKKGKKRRGKARCRPGKAARLAKRAQAVAE